MAKSIQCALNWSAGHRGSPEIFWLLCPRSAAKLVQNCPRTFRSVPRCRLTLVTDAKKSACPTADRSLLMVALLQRCRLRCLPRGLPLKISRTFELPVGERDGSHPLTAFARAPRTTEPRPLHYLYDSLPPTPALCAPTALPPAHSRSLFLCRPPHRRDSSEEHLASKDEPLLYRPPSGAEPLPGLQQARFPQRHATMDAGVLTDHRKEGRRLRKLSQVDGVFD